MIISYSTKPMRIIGIANSTITQEILSFMPSMTDKEYQLITPEEFLALSSKEDYQYLVFFTLDTDLRRRLIDIIETMKLDCFSVIHDSVVCNTDQIGHGTVISPFSTVLVNAKVGKHCLIETYCLVSHYCELGNNVILHSGTMIAGRTKVGANSMFNFKSAALNALTICEDVEIGAVSTVTKDITVPGRYIGSIARYVGERIPFEGQ